MALVEVVGMVYSPAGAYEMWRGRGEKLSARWPIFGLLVLDGLMNAIGAEEAFFGEVTPLALPGLMFPFEFRAARCVSPRSPRFRDETPS